MRKIVSVCALLLMTSMAANTQSATQSAEKFILALENAWNQAQLHQDSSALAALVADGFVNTDYDGTFQNKAEFLADVKDPNYKAEFAANDHTLVHIYGSTAIVTGIYHTKGIYKGKAFDHRGRFTDTWMNLNSKWQCVASHTNLIGTR